MPKLKTRFFIQAFVSLFVLGFGAWALYEYYKVETEREQKEEKARFLSSMDLNEVKELRIDQKKDKLLFAMRPAENTNFVLIEPAQDLIDSAELSQWFSDIKNQKVQKVSSGDLDWKSYYLDSAPFVQLDLVSGDRITFSVSKKSSFDGRYFIKKTKESLIGKKDPGGFFFSKGESELFIGDSSFFSEVTEKNLDDFRSKKILPDLAHATEIHFKGKSNFRLSWNNYKWSLADSSPTDLPLDSSRLDGYWTDINSLKAQSIKSDVNPFSNQALQLHVRSKDKSVNSKNLKNYLLKKYSLNKPALSLELNYNDKKYSLKLSPAKKDKAFITISHRKYIFEISKEQADKLLLDKKEIYDHNFPFKYKTALAYQVERQNGKNSFKVNKEGETWKDQEVREVDSKKLEELLDQVKELRGENYKKRTDKKPLRFFTVKDSEGQLIFELKEISQSKNKSWLQTNLWDKQIAVPKTDIDNIFKQDIFVKKEDKANSTDNKTKKK